MTKPNPETLAFIKTSDEDVVQAIVDSRGLISVAARKLGLKSSSSLRVRINKNPVLAQALKDARKDNINQAEDKLLAAIDNNEPWAIKFYLETIGKEEGYTYQVNLNSHVEVNHSIDLEKLNMEELEKLNDLLAKSTIIDAEPVTYIDAGTSGDL